MLKGLKRRLSNVKPVVKPQGHCPQKRKYVHGNNNTEINQTKRKDLYSDEPDGAIDDIVDVTSKN